MATDTAVALVSGASSGIGAACALELANVGFRVYGTSRREDFRPAGILPLVMDVTDAESVGRAVDEILRRDGRIDCVVNSAGYGLSGAIEDTSVEEAGRQLDTNLLGVLRVCRAVLPAMRRQQSGVIVNISSLGGLFGLPFQGLYAASKFAVEGLTESLRMEVRPFGIRVVLVEPGDVQTAITRNRVVASGAREGSPYSDGFGRAMTVIEREESHGVPPETVAALVARIVRTPRPRLRYTVGHPGQRLSVLLKRALPWSICERILLSFYNGPAQVRSAPSPTHPDASSSRNR